MMIETPPAAHFFIPELKEAVVEGRFRTIHAAQAELDGFLSRQTGGDPSPEAVRDFLASAGTAQLLQDERKQRRKSRTDGGEKYVQKMLTPVEKGKRARARKAAKKARRKNR
jgi:hypothetical protein